MGTAWSCRLHGNALSFFLWSTWSSVANSHHYLNHVDTLRILGSAILAVLLWPLLLLGIDLHIHK